MLVKLTPEQCMAYWAPIREGIIRGMPSFRVTEEGISSIQNQLLVEEMGCWMYVRGFSTDNGIPDIVEAILTTKVISEIATGDISLCIYSLYSKEAIRLEDYKDGFTVLRNYALSKGCKHIVAYTDNERVKQVFRQLGGDASWSILNFQLGV